MSEREYGRLSVLSGPIQPTPAAPAWSWYDTWAVSGLQVKVWEIHIPDDHMVYKLCNYSQAMHPTGWVYCALLLNGSVFYNLYTGYSILYSPGSSSAPKFVHPDVISVAIIHLYASYAVNYYWEMDFWREPRG